MQIINEIKFFEATPEDLQNAKSLENSNEYFVYYDKDEKIYFVENSFHILGTKEDLDSAILLARNGNGIKEKDIINIIGKMKYIPKKT